MKLDGKIALIAGGTGTVGEGIVRTFLREGAQVIVPSRTNEAITKLKELLGADHSERLTTLVGNIGVAAEAEQIRDEVLSRFKRIDAIVASLGGSWDDNLPITEINLNVWQEYFQSNLLAHISLARTFLPVLSGFENTSYTVLGGLSAVMTIPQYSPVSVNSAGLLMMVKTLMEEAKFSGVRINEIILGMINTRARAAYARKEWLTADEVGQLAAYLASQEAYMINGGILQLGNKALKK